MIPTAAIILHLHRGRQHQVGPSLQLLSDKLRTLVYVNSPRPHARIAIYKPSASSTMDQPLQQHVEPHHKLKAHSGRHARAVLTGRMRLNSSRTMETS